MYMTTRIAAPERDAIGGDRHDKTDRQPIERQRRGWGKQAPSSVKHQRWDAAGQRGPSCRSHQHVSRRVVVRHSAGSECRDAAGVFADVVDVEDMVNILACRDAQRPCSLTSWTPNFWGDLTALMPSGRLCRDGVTRMHVFPAQEEIDLAVTRHNRRPIADLHHLRRGSYWRSATVIKRAGDRGELTPNPSCVRQWQMRPYLSAAQSRAAAASHLRWRSSRPSQQCVLLCRVARHAKSR